MFKPSLQVLAGHAGRHVRGLAETNTSRLQRVTTTFLIGGATAAVAAYFFLPDTSKGAPTSDTKPFSPSHFTPAQLVSSSYASNGTKFITVAIPPELLPKEKDIFAPIWSVFIKDDDIQVERPYTPLDGVDKNGNMKFWIKRYEHGEVSRWLHSKKVGDIVEIRGPLKTWSWKDDAWDDIVLVSKYGILSDYSYSDSSAAFQISGGTGITPFYQLMQTVFSGGPTFKGRITLLHSSKTPSELPPADVLLPLLNLARHHPDKFRLKLFVDSFEETGDQSVAGLKIHQGRIGKDSIWRAVHPTSRFPWWNSIFSRYGDDGDRKILFLVCGPEQLVFSLIFPSVLIFLTRASQNGRCYRRTLWPKLFARANRRSFAITRV